MCIVPICYIYSIHRFCMGIRKVYLHMQFVCNYFSRKMRLSLQQLYLLCLLVAWGSYVRDSLWMFRGDSKRNNYMVRQRSARLNLNTAWHRLTVCIPNQMDIERKTVCCLKGVIHFLKWTYFRFLKSERDLTYFEHTSALNSSCPMLISSGVFIFTSNLGKTGDKMLLLTFFLHYRWIEMEGKTK